MTTGQRISTLRKACGLSQEQLADTLGVSRQAVSKWETDQSSPELDNVLALARALSVSTDELLGVDIPLPADRPSGAPLDAAIHANMARRIFTAGWVASVVGLVLLVVEFLALYVIQRSAVEIGIMTGSGFWMDVMAYASRPPMPQIFTLTGILIIGGGILVVYGLWRGRRRV